MITLHTLESCGIIPRVGNTHAHTAGNISLSAKLIYCNTKACSVVLAPPLNFSLATIIIHYYTPINAHITHTIICNSITLIDCHSFCCLKRWYLHMLHHVILLFNTDTFPNGNLSKNCFSLFVTPKRNSGGSDTTLISAPLYCAAIKIL